MIDHELQKKKTSFLLHYIENVKFILRKKYLRDCSLIVECKTEQELRELIMNW